MDTAEIPSLITTGLVVVSVVFPILSLGSVLLRLKARMRTKAGLMGDDWWIVATWVLSLALSINVWVYADLIGINYFKTDPLSGNVYSAVCLVVASCLVQIVLTTVKISILLLYKRIFSIPSFRIAVWIAIVFVSLWGIAMILIVAIQGNPADFVRAGAAGELYAWRLDPAIVGYTQVGSSLILDVVILCFPLPIISTLHMPTKRKVMVGAIFWLGIFLKASVSKQATQFCFLVIEPHCSIIAGCLPTFGPLISGGRAPESLVRSVRSILSLASGMSSPRGSKNRDAVRLPSNNASRQEITTVDDEQGQLPLQSTTKTQINSGTTKVHGDSIELNDLEGGGINVTRGVDVVRS
ncbi:hypothetical protein LA080_013764 [Diaporthe eres]|nr:hypothetical protein LA080_013764 [Diaporthe eres]